jgi:hypothetical protein
MESSLHFCEAIFTKEFVTIYYFQFNILDGRVSFSTTSQGENTIHSIISRRFSLLGPYDLEISNRASEVLLVDPLEMNIPQNLWGSCIYSTPFTLIIVVGPSSKKWGV